MNVVSFFHRFFGPPPPAAKLEAPTAPVPIEQRYWSDPVDCWLHTNRFTRWLDLLDELESESVRVRPLAGGAFASAGEGDRWVWLSWVSASIEGTAPCSVQNYLAANHYWAPNYPGHQLATLRNRASGETVTTRQLIQRALPPEVAHLEKHFANAIFDQRLAVFLALHAGPDGLPSGERLRGIIDADPAAGMEAPSEWTSEWLKPRVYRRWEEKGILYGFTHHTGIVLHTGQQWIAPLCLPTRPGALRNSGCYFDLALLVYAETALQTVARLGPEIVGINGARTSVQATLPWLERVFTTPIDQGRELHRAWKRAAALDLGLK